jgi:hypothetical protein
MVRAKSGLVVQLVRIHACHAWGRGFESRPDRQIQYQNTLKACKSHIYRLFLCLEYTKLFKYSQIKGEHLVSRKEV